ncbi:MAG: DUF1624 domain-containing protein [Lachnospiraceae bacterium]|nr:DUF1624 domain-containing protein [Lachnospiraceae bacterium]
MKEVIINNLKDEKTAKKPRYYVLDIIRGICIVLVVIYHLLYDLSEVFGGNYSFFRSPGMEAFRDAFVGTLILLSGISCNLSKSNIKRGVKTFLCGMLISVVMLVVMPASKVYFGILHFLGFSMILYGLLAKIMEKIPVHIGFLGLLLVHMLTLGVYDGYFGWPGLFMMDIPQMPKNLILFILGFNTGHGAGDHWAIVPWLFLFLSGTFLGRYFKEGNVPKWFEKNPIPPLAFIGRKTLIIYLVHQPLIYGFLYLVYNGIGI